MSSRFACPIALALFAALAGPLLPPAAAQDWTPQRCKEIRTTLEHYTAGGGKLRGPNGADVEIRTITQAREKRVAAEVKYRQQEERLAVARRERGTATTPTAIEKDAMLGFERARAEFEPLLEEENRIARLINLLRDQQVRLNCPGEPARAETVAAGPPAPATTGSTGADAPTVPPAPPAAGDNWSGVWSHAFGTITFRLATDTNEVVQLIRTANAYGPAGACDGGPVYRGEVDWSAPGGGFDRRWRGQVYACTNGTALHGKFSNFGAHSAMDPDFSAGFRLALAGATSFTGEYRTYDTRTQQTLPFPGWTGTRP